MGLLRHAPDAMGGLENRQWMVHVFLNDCTLSGIVEGTHRRLNDHLQAIEDQITLRDAVVSSLRTGKELIRKQIAIITVPNILFVVDCSKTETDSLESALRVEKRAEDTMLNAGSFWIKGQLHIPPEGDVNNFIRAGAGSFIPVTEAMISGHEQHNGRTVLVNRTHIRCLLL